MLEDGFAFDPLFSNGLDKPKAFELALNTSVCLDVITAGSILGPSISLEGPVLKLKVDFEGVE